MQKHSIFKNLINICKKTLMPIACIVVFCTFYVLVLPAITVSNDTLCGIEEHIHQESCFNQSLQCDLEEAIHAHDESCYKIEYICHATTEVHEHHDECYKNDLICEIVDEGHEHSEDCYQKTLVCEQSTTHEHNESCEQKVLNCSVEQGHTHVESCYIKENVCLKEEHIHSLICYSDKNADLESKEQWEAVLPTLGEETSENIILIAQSQLGYKESELNYEVIDEEVYGYNRYGVYFHEPYAKWNTLFVRFVFDYADVEIYSHQDIQTWYESEDNIFTDQPNKGDLIFIDANKDGIADHVGIIESLDDSIIKTIQGDIENTVSYVTYELDDETILGYVTYPIEQESLSSIESMHELGSIEANFDEGVLDENTEIQVGFKQQELNDLEVVDSQVFDVTFVDQQGNQVQPQGTVALTMNFNEPLQTQTGASWSLKTVNENDTEDKDALLETTSSNELTEASFDYENTTFALTAVQPRATTVSNRTDLSKAISNANRNGTLTQIVIGGNFTMSSSLDITGGRNIEIDLNGHTITATYRAFVVDNATLTIVDSKANQETITNLGIVNNDMTGQLASLSNNVLTYYVTESEIVDSQLGATQEELIKHQVQMAGNIITKNESYWSTVYPIITVESGTFNLEGGMLRGAENRAINQTGGTVNLNGGYICDNHLDGTGYGGAIINNGGTLNVNGSIIAGNSARDGGAIYLAGSTLNITDGAISGNQATYTSDGHGGGGVRTTGTSRITMSGGYVTNNHCIGTSYSCAGGGFLLYDNTTMYCHGGYITGNNANSGGGIASDWDEPCKIYIEKVDNIQPIIIASNIARGAEGGGVLVNSSTQCAITAGYITNNKTLTEQHWGGGGLFCAQGGELFIYNVIAAENHAGGYGGGIAGCSTGRIYICVKEGGAIFQNSADGLHMSGDESSKSEDREYAFNNEVFNKYGYEDYFCALNSVVEGTMLGGHSANWDGSADGYHVSVGKGETVEANYIMGLSAYPTDTGKQAAINEAKVYINGNDSYTHGGGVLANGYLIVGEPDEITVGDRIGVSTTKTFSNYNGNLSMDNNNFKFEIVDANNQAVVSRGTCDSSGNVTFMERLPFNKDGTFTYYVREVEGDDPSIIYDSTEYALVVTVEKTTSVQNSGINSTLTKTRYDVTEIVIYVRDHPNDSWEEVQTVIPDNGEHTAYNLKLTKSGAGFTNYKLSQTKISVRKEWASDTRLDSVTVRLYRNNEYYDPSGTGSGTVTLSSSNSWKHTWSGLPLSSDYEYTVVEDPLDHYIAGYEKYNVTTTNSSGRPTANETVFVITNTEKEEILYALDITKKSSKGDDITLTGAVFNLLDEQGNPLSFTKISEGAYELSTQSTSTTTELVTGARGKLYISGLYKGTYTIRETQAPNGYFEADDIIVEVGNNDEVSVALEIIDIADDGYKLPDTGGIGTFSYITGGSVLILIALLLYINNKKKELL